MPEFNLDRADAILTLMTQAESMQDQHINVGQHGEIIKNSNHRFGRAINWLLSFFSSNATRNTNTIAHIGNSVRENLGADYRASFLEKMREFNTGRPIHGREIRQALSEVLDDRIDANNLQSANITHDEIIHSFFDNTGEHYARVSGIISAALTGRGIEQAFVPRNFNTLVKQAFTQVLENYAQEERLPLIGEAAIRALKNVVNSQATELAEYLPPVRLQFEASRQNEGVKSFLLEGWNGQIKELSPAAIGFLQEQYAGAVPLVNKLLLARGEQKITLTTEVTDFVRNLNTSISADALMSAEDKAIVLSVMASCFAHSAGHGVTSGMLPAVFKNTLYDMKLAHNAGQQDYSQSIQFLEQLFSEMFQKKALSQGDQDRFEALLNPTMGMLYLSDLEAIHATRGLLAVLDDAPKQALSDEEKAQTLAGINAVLATGFGSNMRDDFGVAIEGLGLQDGDEAAWNLLSEQTDLQNQLSQALESLSAESKEIFTRIRLLEQKKATLGDADKVIIDARIQDLLVMHQDNMDAVRPVLQCINLMQDIERVAASIEANTEAIKRFTKKLTIEATRDEFLANPNNAQRQHFSHGFLKDLHRSSYILNGSHIDTVTSDAERATRLEQNIRELSEQLGSAERAGKIFLYLYQVLGQEMHMASNPVNPMLSEYFATPTAELSSGSRFTITESVDHAGFHVRVEYFNKHLEESAQYRIDYILTDLDQPKPTLRVVDMSLIVGND